MLFHPAPSISPHCIPKDRDRSAWLGGQQHRGEEGGEGHHQTPFYPNLTPWQTWKLNTTQKQWSNMLCCTSCACRRRHSWRPGSISSVHLWHVSCWDNRERHRSFLSLFLHSLSPKWIRFHTYTGLPHSHAVGNGKHCSSHCILYTYIRFTLSTKQRLGVFKVLATRLKRPKNENKKKKLYKFPKLHL